MSITYSGPNNTTGLTTLAPGTGSTGFSSNAVVTVNSSGQLTAASTSLELTSNGVLSVYSTSVPSLRISTAQGANGLVIQQATSGNAGIAGSVAGDMILRAAATQKIIMGVGSSQLLTITSAGNVQVGIATQAGKLSLPSTVNMTSAVGGAGAAAALPATPESYIKVLAPNNAGTFTTLYIPMYLSTA